MADGASNLFGAVVGSASAHLAAGDLSARAPTGGARELAALADSFNAMAVSIEQLFDARRELVAWASHDLRTPLASMQAMIEAIEDGLAEPGDYLPTLREQVRTLTLLVDDLFELARIDAGALTLELHRLPVSGIVDSALRLLEPEAAARHVDLVAHAEGETTADVAPEKIERVLFNLITNALRHTPSDGSVAVNVARQHGELLVSVEVLLEVSVLVELLVSVLVELLVSVVVELLVWVDVEELLVVQLSVLVVVLVAELLELDSEQGVGVGLGSGRTGGFTEMVATWPASLPSITSQRSLRELTMSTAGAFCTVSE